MELLIVSSCIVASLLLVWFRTDAYPEYCRALKLDKISFYKDFYAKLHDDVRLTYVKYLRQYHNGFFVRLITCPLCIGAWIATALSLIFTTWTIGWTAYIFGLILFAITDKLLD
jgi:hypothetical protein